KVAPSSLVFLDRLWRRVLVWLVRAGVEDDLTRPRLAGPFQLEPFVIGDEPIADPHEAAGGFLSLWRDGHADVDADVGRFECFWIVSTIQVGSIDRDDLSRFSFRSVRCPLWQPDVAKTLQLDGDIFCRLAMSLRCEARDVPAALAIDLPYHLDN